MNEIELSIRGLSFAAIPLIAICPVLLAIRKGRSCRPAKMLVKARKYTREFASRKPMRSAPSDLMGGLTPERPTAIPKFILTFQLKYN
jgi:hypothetical protein